MIRRNHKILSLLAVTVVMLACVTPSLAPASTPIPTFDPNSLNTAIVQTADAAATQTALMLPPTFTATPTPRSTHTPTGTPTATFYFVLATITSPPTQIPFGSSGLEHECQILSQTPENNSAMFRMATFEARWLVANIGTVGWDTATADYRYYKGDDLHLQPIYDFESSVPPGGTIELVASMQAPSVSGTYSTSWRIGIGKSRFCPMDLTIVVN